MLSSCELELLGSDTLALMGLLALLASLAKVNASRGFFPALRFGSRKTPISFHNFSESSLAPFQFGSAFLFHRLHFVRCVGFTKRAVGTYIPW